MLFEVLRWRSGMRTGGDDFRLNNNYHALFARLIMQNEPDLAGLFELRELHEPAQEPPPRWRASTSLDAVGTERCKASVQTLS
jgi:hypothetical protein